MKGACSCRALSYIHAGHGSKPVTTIPARADDESATAIDHRQRAHPNPTHRHTPSGPPKIENSTVNMMDGASAMTFGLTSAEMPSVAI